MTLKPGGIVEMEGDFDAVRHKGLKASVYEAEGGIVILSQTTPPLPALALHRTVQLTYLASSNEPPRRYRTAARIVGFTQDYRLASGQCVDAITLELLKPPQEVNLRNSFRIRPHLESGLAFRLGPHSHPIYDISVGGICFLQPLSQPPPAVAERHSAVLEIDGTPYALKLCITRVEAKARTRRISAAFAEMARGLESALSRKILFLERQELAKGR